MKLSICQVLKDKELFLFFKIYCLRVGQKIAFKTLSPKKAFLSPPFPNGLPPKC